ncbi:MAG: hypothetical protein QM751_03250 [Paludibacteraceae bacterium]
MELKLNKKVVFVIGVLLVFVTTFLPFIFWDTKEWIFFSRNPFLTQSAVGNKYVLVLMMILGAILGYRWKDLSQFSYYASIFVFLFILASQITLVLMVGIRGDVFSDSQYDISYFSLFLPYCVSYMSGVFNK